MSIEETKTVRQIEDDHIREIIDLRFMVTEKALNLQAREYERRLLDLNNEAARLAEMQRTYLPRETYEVRHQAILNKIEGLQKIVYVGLGIILVLEFFFKLAK